MFVGKMLELTAPAVTKVHTGSEHSFGRRTRHLQHLGEGLPVTLLVDARDHRLPGKRPHDGDLYIAGTGEPLTGWPKGLDLEHEWLGSYRLRHGQMPITA
jgi:hypothetical protein